MPALVVKKYPNRRLYDTSTSRYITLEDLAERIRAGSDVAVQDAHSGADLTQATLVQIILESRGGARLLPVPLLLRLIRLGDEALAEFLGRYVSWALELYVGARDRARTLLPLNPLATAPFAATDAFARLLLGASGWQARPPRGHQDDVPAPREPDAAASGGAAPDEAPTTDAPAGGAAGPPVTAGVADEISRLRRDMEELKRALEAAGGGAPRSRRPRRK